MKLLTGGCFQTLPFSTLDQFHHQTVSEAADRPLIQYSYVVKSIFTRYGKGENFRQCKYALCQTGLISLTSP